MAFGRYGQNLLVGHERMSRVLVAVALPSKHLDACGTGHHLRQ